MRGRAYLCSGCKHGFYFANAANHPAKCPSCGKKTLEPPADWEEFDCPRCNKKYDILTIQLMADSHSLPEGIIKCKIDDTELLWAAPGEDQSELLVKFETDDEAWSEAIQQKQEEEKRVELEWENLILQASLDRKKENLPNSEGKLNAD